LAILYGCLFAAYAVIRSSTQIAAVIGIGGDFTPTVMASGFAILVASLAAALLIGVFAALLETVALVVSRSVVVWLDWAQEPRRAAGIGFCVAAAIALALNLLVWRGGGIFMDQLWPSGYLFWFGLPCLIFVAATTWAMSRWIVTPAPIKL
jgi:hypothetical protein